MIGRWANRSIEEDVSEGPRGFDDFELRLGDIMRGERATMGKSLLDVQRELKIKAAYIAAIENADPTAFDTPGFIAGYVRSYARYLNLDPEWAFQTFCDEGQFETAHGMSSEASSTRPSREERLAALGSARSDPFAAPATPFVPAGERMFAQVEPGAIGSSLVLVALVAGLGFGGWTVLQEVQKVQVAPIDQAPVVAATVDPLAAAPVQITQELTAGVVPAAPDALDRLYRPQALDVPVMQPRDAAISTLSPEANGAFASPTALASLNPADAAPAYPGLQTASAIQVVEEAIPPVTLFAVQGSWIRVRAADGTVIFEKILDAGEEYVLPVTEEPATLRAGNSGSLYFRVDGEIYGPAGSGTSTVKNVALAAADLRDSYLPTDLIENPEVVQVVAELTQVGLPEEAGE